MILGTAMVVALAGVLLAGCGSDNGGTGPTVDEDLQALQSKVPLLQTDECYRSDAHTVFPRCDKYVTELASTVGALRKELAPKSRALRDDANALGSGIDRYQNLDCGLITGAPSSRQRENCPKALVTIHDSLRAMGDYLATLPGGNE